MGGVRAGGGEMQYLQCKCQSRGAWRRNCGGLSGRAFLATFLERLESFPPFCSCHW